MKLLKCPSIQCLSLGAMLPPNKAHPEGEPFLVGGYTPSYRCARCRKHWEVSLTAYNAMPDVDMDGFKDLARLYRSPSLATLPLKDLIGAGMTRDQAEYLFRQDFHGGYWLGHLSTAHAVDRMSRNE